jgi:hypothetical protein
MVLKDYWLDKGMDSEGTTQKKLFADLAGVTAILAPLANPSNGQVASTVTGALPPAT